MASFGSSTKIGEVVVNASEGGSIKHKLSGLSADGVIPIGSEISTAPTNAKKNDVNNFNIRDNSSNNEFDEAADRQR